jgi:hypothetical protein
MLVTASRIALRLICSPQIQTHSLSGPMCSLRAGATLSHWPTVKRTRADVTLSHSLYILRWSLVALAHKRYTSSVALRVQLVTLSRSLSKTALPVFMLTHWPTVNLQRSDHTITQPIHERFGHLSHCHTSPLSGLSAAVTLSHSLAKKVLPVVTLSHRPSGVQLECESLSHCHPGPPCSLSATDTTHCHTVDPSGFGHLSHYHTSLRLTRLSAAVNVTKPMQYVVVSCHTVTQAPQCSLRAAITLSHTTYWHAVTTPT